MFPVRWQTLQIALRPLKINASYSLKYKLFLNTRMGALSSAVSKMSTTTSGITASAKTTVSATKTSAAVHRRIAARRHVVVITTRPNGIYKTIVLLSIPARVAIS